MTEANFLSATRIPMAKINIPHGEPPQAASEIPHENNVARLFNIATNYFVIIHKNGYFS
jgi:hypothetical protein